MNPTTIQELFKIGMDREIEEILLFGRGLILNVGAGNKQIYGTIPLDWPEWNADVDKIPYADESIQGIHCYHFLEHCARPERVLMEFQRVLVRGGIVNVVVPFYNSSMQAQDLDHKARFCENTWKTLFRNPYYDKNRTEWKFRVGLNIIIAVAERNLCLMTQLIKE